MGVTWEDDKGEILDDPREGIPTEPEFPHWASGIMIALVVGILIGLFIVLPIIIGG